MNSNWPKGALTKRARHSVRPPRGTKPGLVANAGKRNEQGKYLYVPRSIATAAGVCGVRQSDGTFAKGCGASLVKGVCPMCARDAESAPAVVVPVLDRVPRGYVPRGGRVVGTVLQLDEDEIRTTGGDGTPAPEYKRAAGNVAIF